MFGVRCERLALPAGGWAGARRVAVAPRGSVHLLGLNHKKLTFNYAGRDFRLTAVHGNVAKEILA